MTTYVLYGESVERKPLACGVVSVREHLEFRFASAPDEGQKLYLEIADEDVIAPVLEGGFQLWILRGGELRAEYGEYGRAGEVNRTPALGDWPVQGLQVLSIDPTDALVQKTAAQVEAANQNQLLQLDTASPEPWSPCAWQAGAVPPPRPRDDAGRRPARPLAVGGSSPAEAGPHRPGDLRGRAVVRGIAAALLRVGSL